jgi:vacuolar-type H+-ATPase subunit E/Vma4
MKGAENKFASIENLSDEELEALHSECRARAETMLDHIEERRSKSSDGKRRTAAHATKALRKTAKA